MHCERRRAQKKQSAGKIRCDGITREYSLCFHTNCMREVAGDDAGEKSNCRGESEPQPRITVVMY